MLASLGTSAIFLILSYSFTLDQPGKKGSNGSRVGMTTIVSESDAQLLETLTKANSKHTLKS